MISLLNSFTGVAAAFGGYAYGVKSSVNQYEPDNSLGIDKANCYVAHEEAWRFRCAGFNCFDRPHNPPGYQQADY